jgi:superfamily II DNA/RNA helicase
MSYNRYGGQRGRSNSFGRPNRNFGNRGRQTRPAHRGQDIHYSKFINKGVDVALQQYEPKHTFADFAIDPRIKTNIAKKGYKTPTAIQDQAIPVVLEGRDIVGIANTGTGKTGAFLIPLLHKVAMASDERVLIMVPTRELAIQIEDEYRGFSQGSGLRSVSVVGGANINPQMRALRDDPYFVIGTPGRIKDLIQRRALDLSKFQTVVLDEADRMLDMGFIGDMRYILSLMPQDRHTLFFSATLSSDIEKLIKDFLKDPVRISVKTGDTSKSVDQDVVHMEGKNKIDVLHELLAQPEFDKVIVFGRTKHGVDKLSKVLAQRGIPSAAIHGNKSQSKRQRALGEFKQNRVKVLIATDVAARGLDIPKVSHVINFDVPGTYEDYVHRIGRTGRAGERGKALTFID